MATSDAEESTGSLISDGKKRRHPFGLTFYEPRGKLRVRTVEAGSPADQLGIAPGSTIIGLKLDTGGWLDPPTKAQALLLLTAEAAKESSAVDIRWTPPGFSKRQRGRPPAKASTKSSLAKDRDRKREERAVATEEDKAAEADRKRMERAGATAEDKAAEAARKRSERATASQEQRAAESSRRQLQRKSRSTADLEAHRDRERERYQAKTPEEKQTYRERNTAAMAAARGSSDTVMMPPVKEADKAIAAVLARGDVAGWNRQMKHSSDMAAKAEKEMKVLESVFSTRFSLSETARAKVEEKMAEQKSREVALKTYETRMEALRSQYQADCFFYSQKKDGAFGDAMPALLGMPYVREMGFLEPSSPAVITSVGDVYRMGKVELFDVVVNSWAGKTMPVKVLKVPVGVQLPAFIGGGFYDQFWDADEEAEELAAKDCRAEDGEVGGLPSVPTARLYPTHTVFRIKSGWRKFGPEENFFDAYSELTGQPKPTKNNDGSRGLCIRPEHYKKDQFDGSAISKKYWYQRRKGFDLAVWNPRSRRTLIAFVSEEVAEVADPPEEPQGAGNQDHSTGAAQDHRDQSDGCNQQ